MCSRRGTYARETIAAFEQEGATAELRELPGLRHWPSPAILADLMARVRAAVEAISAGSMAPPSSAIPAR